MGMTSGSTVATIHSESLFGDDPRGRSQVVVIDGPDEGRAAGLESARVVVGRDPDCDLVLRDTEVSPRHLEIQDDGDGFVIRDLGSTAGTRYAGSSIREAKVSLGATLKVGQTFLRLQPQPEPLEVAASQSRRFGDLVAESLTMREVFAVGELASRSAITVLLEGEIGTGKELTARAIHGAGDRRIGPFVSVDCGALPDVELEATLFGIRRGSDLPGAVRRARGGSLFLDEIGAMSPPVQTRLLQVLEEQAMHPIGKPRAERPEARVIVASRVNLATRVADGSFRPDLYYRVSVLRIELPPLRDRREDLAPITRQLLHARGFQNDEVAGANLDRLLAHDWPGNVLELRNAIDRALTLSPRARRFDDLRLLLSEGGDRAGSDPLEVRSDLRYGEARQLLLEAFDIRYLSDVLDRCGGDVAAAAREAGIDRSHLRGLLREHGLLDEQ